MLVVEFKKSKLDIIPNDFYLDLPENCESCGYPLEINLPLTELKCSNKLCKDKIIPRLLEIKNALGIDVDINDIDCTDYMSILQYSEYKNFTLLEYLRLANLPIINPEILNKYFAEINDLDNFYNMLDLEDIITEENIEFDVINMFDKLMAYKDVLLSGLKYINLIDYNNAIYIKEADRKEALKLEDKINKHIAIDNFYYEYNNLGEVMP